MGFMKNMFAQLEKEVGKALTEQMGSSASSSSSKTKKNKRHSGGPATRWEKAVVSLDKIVSQTVKVDPDGVDIVCFGGEGEAQWYRNIKDTKNIEEMVNDKRPRGVSYNKLLLRSILNHPNRIKKLISFFFLLSEIFSFAEMLHGICHGRSHRRCL